MKILFKGYYTTDKVLENDLGEKYREIKWITVSFPRIKQGKPTNCNKVATGHLIVSINLPLWISMKVTINASEETVEIEHGVLSIYRDAVMCLDDDTVYI